MEIGDSMKFLPDAPLFEPACVCDGCEHAFTLVPVGASGFKARADGREAARYEFDDPDDPYTVPMTLCEDCQARMDELASWRAEHPLPPPDMVVDFPLEPPPLPRRRA